jgi:hypothetical protein
MVTASRECGAFSWTQERCSPTIVSLYFFFDESGDYVFPEERFDCYVQAALICPDSVLPAIAAFVDERMAAWGVEELHATELALDQRLEVARFIQESDSQLLAHVTDRFS